ncbi:unnamed protein product [Adineta steineri]|uniref:Uncharacterized protein n=1 Tax=Adineta steineri TaxID=433720 RepID=A0A815SEU9_9BILA|nr:unnamed protein product [Adineta steineri]CAF1482755.1 unnamed protein product [Adineta steineri]CAF1489219.1 unnamed protein product [Adineta steineri]CAF4059430.1 unnamed protein product [Adineta steineri]CAF4080676.1 unnamed protein product [Adineta steineri]
MVSKSKLKSNTKVKTNLWSLISVEQLSTAIASLGNHVNQLKKETWRLNKETKLPTSLWAQVIEKLLIYRNEKLNSDNNKKSKLEIDHNEDFRKSLYNVWYSKRQDIDKLVENKLKKNGKDGAHGDNGYDDEIDKISSIEKSIPNLLAEVSLPLPQKPNTRAEKSKDEFDNGTENSINNEISISLSTSEWKAAFSCTRQKMNAGWTTLFYNKLKSSGITCAVAFKKSHVKKGKRKHKCDNFWCRAKCTNSECTRTFLIILKNKPDVYTSAVFLVRIFGVENHNPKNETMTRRLCGEERYHVGERANEIGPLAVLRERIEAADENLLAAGNHTGCETIEVTKKAGADFRKANQIDENIFTACRIVGSVYQKADVTSTTVQGYVQVVGEMPFRVHLFSEPQIERYVNYCKKEKYSYVHIDATGGVLKHLSEQNQTLLYAVVFKDGTDCINTIPLAHAFLTNHTVPSITYFLGSLSHEITEFKKKKVLPSFFVIDFSASLMNSILLAFNEENINTHLNRCWNVLNRNYNTVELRSLSFIHLCCSHVIHAIARSLNSAQIDKKIRRGVLHIFAFILCGNNLNQLYDILGLVIDIFGDPNEQNAQEKFEKMLALELDVDEESVTLLSHPKEILEEAKKKDDKLKIVDEYFRSNTPIIHQSPFNKEAIRLYPNLKKLIDNKSKYDKIVNPLFAPALIRIFYRWWAYLPLWTGVLWNFEERYSNSHQTNASVIYNPVRHSNALIESYFRTLKQSILKRKIGTQPQKIIEEIHRSIQVQFKALKYEVTQSSKGRKRRKNRDGEWKKNGIGVKCRKLHVKAMDAFGSLYNRSKMKNAPVDDVMKENSEEETASTISSLSQLSISLDGLNDKICTKEPSESGDNNSKSSSIESLAMVSNKYSIDVRTNLDKLTPDKQQFKPSNNFNHDNEEVNDNVFSLFNTMHSVDHQYTSTTDQPSRQPEALIDGVALRWPKFGIKNSIFRGRSFTLTYTCPTDSALFALYCIYKTDINIAGEFDNAPDTSGYSTLSKVFRTVEQDGWDTARLYWLYTNGILEGYAKKKSLFGSVDDQVFRFLTCEQRYSQRVICSRVQCKKRDRTRTTSELHYFTCDDGYIRDFKNESVEQCNVEIGYSNEITTDEVYEHGYRHDLARVINNKTCIDEYQDVWLCNALIDISAATFTNNHPPIIIVHIRHVLIESEKKKECSDNHPQLSDIKREITINSIK